MGFAARGLLRFSVAWDWAGAQADIAKALEIDPNNPVIIRRYADLQINLGHFPEAIAFARKATDLDPFSAAAWQVLSFAPMAGGDLAGANEAARHSMAIDPTDNLGTSSLASAELLDRRPVEALAVFQQVVGDDPNWAAAQLTGIAMAEHSLGHAKESQKALGEAIATVGKLNPF